MSKSKLERLVELVREMPGDVVLRAAGHCDGHGILDPKAFTDAGVPAEVVEHLTRKYRSDGTPKGTIFVNGVPVEELNGIYGLDALRFFADALGVEYASCIGRGFQAQAIQQALHAHFNRSEQST